jgi:superkiller protein 3
VYCDLKRYDEAIAEYQRAIELDPKYAYPHNGLGSVYYDLKRYDEAIAEYQRSVELDPKYATPHNNLGNVYYDLKRYDAAIAEYQQAIQIDPKFAEAYSNLADVLETVERMDEAVRLYEKSFELKPRGKPQNALGLLYQRQGALDKALEAYKIAVELSPEDASYHSSLASIYHTLGNETEYAKQSKIAREFITKENEYNRACFESICGNVDEALALLKVALEKKQVSLLWARRDPDFDFIRDDPRFQALVGE